MKMPIPIPMPIRWHILAAVLLVTGLSACSTYAPIKLDAKNGQYTTSTQLDAGATRVWETGTNLTEFRIVMLAMESNVYPLRFEYFVRSALFDLGIKRVLNVDEMSALLADRGLGSKVNSDSLRKLSQAGLPVLMAILVG